MGSTGDLHRTEKDRRGKGDHVNRLETDVHNRKVALGADLAFGEKAQRVSDQPGKKKEAKNLTRHERGA